MRSRFLACLSSAAVLLVGAPSLAADQPQDADQALLELYFPSDETVEVATGTAKPLLQVAENVTIIDRAEIEAMHLHTVAEVLDRQGGVMLSFVGRDYGAGVYYNLLGTRARHTTVLLDGIRINDAAGGTPITNFIPLGIVKRIEIIKGPASSTWGSALGGVVNIITRETGRFATPTGEAAATYGAGASRELSLDVAGIAGPASYYLYGGDMRSDGIRLDRSFDRQSLYGKVRVALPNRSSLSLTGGFSDPERRSLNWSDGWDIPGFDLYERSRHENYWGTVAYDAPLGEQYALHLALQRFQRDYRQNYHSLGGVAGPADEFVFGQRWNEYTTSLVSRLSWAGERASGNLGFETSRSRMVSEDAYGVLWGPSTTVAAPEFEERRGLYGNATLVFGDLTLSPGLRYDFHSRSEEFVSPSLGMTYSLSKDTLLRASVARGFAAPYLATFANNPGLKPEHIWAYQGGIETYRLPTLRLKATLFYQEVADGWNMDTTPWQNSGVIRWRGADLEAETARFHGLSLRGNLTYTEEDSIKDGTVDLSNDEMYAANLLFDYANEANGVKGQLNGHYVRMSESIKNELPADNNTLWDLTVTKAFAAGRSGQAEIFVAVHNLFDGAQYWDYEYPNAGRWLECGLTFRY